MSDSGAITEILNNLSFAKSVKFDDHSIKKDLLAMALLLFNV
ncbi:hypothetical protein QUS22_00555 [Wolbachia pipientis]|nr:hypothetical protein [Wolbachia pipientis]